MRQSCKWEDSIIYHSVFYYIYVMNYMPNGKYILLALEYIGLVNITYNLLEILERGRYAIIVAKIWA